MFFMTWRTLSLEPATFVAGSPQHCPAKTSNYWRTKKHSHNLPTTCLLWVTPMGHYFPAISPLPLSPPLSPPLGPYSSSALEETFTQMWFRLHTAWQKSFHRIWVESDYCPSRGVLNVRLNWCTPKCILIYCPLSLSFGGIFDSLTWVVVSGQHSWKEVICRQTCFIQCVFVGSLIVPLVKTSAVSMETGN